MHKLARLSEGERRSLIDDFLDAVFGGLGAEPSFAGIRRLMTPELPDDPEAEQVQAWAELAELTQDPDFRASMRRMAGVEAAELGQATPRSCAATSSRSSVTRRARPSPSASSRTRRRHPRSSRR